MQFVGFLVFAMCAMAFFVFINSKSKKSGKTMETYIDRERSANTTADKEIPTDLFIKVDKDRLKLDIDYTDVECDELVKKKINRYCNTISKMAEKDILHLDETLTNTEIKEKFGYRNLDYIIVCEERFNILTRNMYELAKELVKMGKYEDAERFLDYAIELGDRSSKVYKKLIDVYYQNYRNTKYADFEKKLPDLKDSLDETVYNKISNYYMEVKKNE